MHFELSYRQISVMSEVMEQKKIQNIQCDDISLNLDIARDDDGPVVESYTFYDDGSCVRSLGQQGVYNDYEVIQAQASREESK
jgi:hypothetical protein